MKTRGRQAQEDNSKTPKGGGGGARGGRGKGDSSDDDDVKALTAPPTELLGRGHRISRPPVELYEPTPRVTRREAAKVHRSGSLSPEEVDALYKSRHDSRPAAAEAMKEIRRAARHSARRDSAGTSTSGT